MHTYLKIEELSPVRQSEYSRAPRRRRPHWKKTAVASTVDLERPSSCCIERDTICSGQPSFSVAGKTNKNVIHAHKNIDIPTSFVK